MCMFMSAEMGRRSCFPLHPMKRYLDLARAATLHDKGFSNEEITIELGVSKITVQRWRKRTNKKPNKHVVPVK